MYSSPDGQQHPRLDQQPFRDRSQDGLPGRDLRPAHGFPRSSGTYVAPFAELVRTALISFATSPDAGDGSG
jgi:hypothetical protein